MSDDHVNLQNRLQSILASRRKICRALPGSHEAAAWERVFRWLDEWKHVVDNIDWQYMDEGLVGWLGETLAPCEDLIKLPDSDWADQSAQIRSKVESLLQKGYVYFAKAFSLALLGHQQASRIFDLVDNTHGLLTRAENATNRAEEIVSGLAQANRGWAIRSAKKIHSKAWSRHMSFFALFLGAAAIGIWCIFSIVPSRVASLVLPEQWSPYSVLAVGAYSSLGLLLFSLVALALKVAFAQLHLAERSAHRNRVVSGLPVYVRLLPEKDPERSQVIARIVDAIADMGDTGLVKEGDGSDDVRKEIIERVSRLPGS